jgi:hypothetical protein
MTLHPDQTNEIQIEATWRTLQTVEVPDGADADEARDAIKRGELPEWAAEQIDASAAELTDWTAY